MTEERPLPARLVVAPAHPAGVGLDRRPRPDRRAAGAARASFHDPALFGGVRPFQPGDPLRRIHWRATARVGRPVSRRWEPARSRQVVLVLDVQTLAGPAWEMSWDPDAFEGLCVAAASLARTALNGGAAVGLAAAGFSGTAQRVAYLPEPGGRRPSWRASPTSWPGSGPISSGSLGGLLTWLVRRVPSGASLVILTARLAALGRPFLRRLAASGYGVEVLVLGSEPEAAEAALGDARRAGIAARSMALDPDWETADVVALSA